MDVNGFGTLGAREQLEQKHDGLQFVVERHEDTDGFVEYTLEKYGSAPNQPDAHTPLHIPLALRHSLNSSLPSTRRPLGELQDLK